MKKANLLLLPCFSLLTAISLHGQSSLEQELEDGRWEIGSVFENESTTPSTDSSSSQSSSPLMMFGGKAVEADSAEGASDSRKMPDRSDGRSGAGGGPSSSSAARGTASGLAEEGEDEDSLTLDHFRTALAQNPTANRFVIVEDEENEGGISIEPRAAGTSKFARSKNKVENTTIIEALRELLITRHRCGAEIVNSFFDGDTKADAPLSADGLREIIRRSDDFQKPISSKKFTPQKAAPSSASENEATSQLDNSSVNKYLQDTINNNIYTRALAEVALITDRQLFGATDALQYNKATNEWSSAEEAALIDVERSNRLLENAKRDTEISRSTSSAAQGLSVLAEKIAEARRETAYATLRAIRTKKSSLNAEAAEIELAEAQQVEDRARTAYNQAETAATEEMANIKETPGAKSLHWKKVVAPFVIIAAIYFEPWKAYANFPAWHKSTIQPWCNSLEAYPDASIRNWIGCESAIKSIAKEETSQNLQSSNVNEVNINGATISAPVYITLAGGNVWDDTSQKKTNKIESK